MWSSQSLRMASWNASADALIGACPFPCGSLALAVPALRSVARARAASRHTSAAVARRMPCDFRVLIKANPSFLFEKHQQARGGTSAAVVVSCRALEAHASAREPHREHDEDASGRPEPDDESRPLHPQRPELGRS